VFLKDFSPDAVTKFRGEWKVNGKALKIQSERLKQFFKYCHDYKWIPENPAAKLKAPMVKQEPVYAFPKEDRDELLKAVSENNFLLAMNLTMRYSALAPVDIVFLKARNLHGDRIVTTRKKTGKRVNVKLPSVVAERLKALPVQAGGFWFWNRLDKNSKHETATGNLRRMMRPYFQKAKVYQRDEHGEVVYEQNNESGELKPLLGTLYQWRHTFVHERIMNDVTPSRIYELTPSADTNNDACQLCPPSRSWMGIVAPVQSRNIFSPGLCCWRRTTSCFPRHRWYNSQKRLYR
jgi:integrase